LVVLVSRDKLQWKVEQDYFLRLLLTSLMRNFRWMFGSDTNLPWWCVLPVHCCV